MSNIISGSDVINKMKESYRLQAEDDFGWGGGGQERLF